MRSVSGDGDGGLWVGDLADALFDEGLGPEGFELVLRASLDQGEVGDPEVGQGRVPVRHHIRHVLLREKQRRFEK